MNGPQFFAVAIEAMFDTQCMATQDAIDRLVEAGPFRGRVGMLESLRNPHYYDGVRFVATLLEAWKEADIERATGHTRDWWIETNEKFNKRAP